MNVQDFTYLIQHPEKVVSPSQTKQLEEVIEAYPYFQGAHALHLKGLKHLNSFRYNDALKVTAAYTSNRDILFDFITSKDFLQNKIADSISGKTASLEDTETIIEEVGTSETEKRFLIEESPDSPLPRDTQDADKILDPKLFSSKKPEPKRSDALEKKEDEEDLQLGEPLQFTKKEKYSFTEWLSLASKKKDRPEKEDTLEALSDIDFPLEEERPKNKKFELIDRFIAENPRIVPKKDRLSEIDITASTKIDKTELMTETLAKVYLEQKKYKKAIQAYKILGLKYPEKSGFFADRINAVKKLQERNT
ncbi:MAG: hypothetical protein AAFX53_02955 [Bacteroidota bacterium]